MFISYDYRMIITLFQTSRFIQKVELNFLCYKYFAANIDLHYNGIESIFNVDYLKFIEAILITVVSYNSCTFKTPFSYLIC